MKKTYRTLVSLVMCAAMAGGDLPAGCSRRILHRLDRDKPDRRVYI